MKPSVAIHNPDAAKSYTLDDLQSDVDHLGHLIATAVDTIMECDFGPVGNRVPHMDRVSALLWIARDMADSLSVLIEEHHVEIGTTRVKSGRS